MPECPDSTLLNTTLIIPGEARASVPKRTRENFTNRHRFAGNENIQAVCEQKLGFSPVSISPVTGSKGAALFALTSAQGKRYFFKIGMFQDHHDPAYELFFNTVVTSCNPMLPVPEIYLLDLSGESIPWQYSVIERLPGISIKKCITDGFITDNDHIFEQFGESIHHIHDITLSARGFGSLSWSGVRDFLTQHIIPPLFQCVHESFDERYIDPFDAGLSCLVRSSIISQRDYENAQTVIPASIPDESGTCFLHGDISPGNFLVEKSRITGILDGSGVIGFRIEELADLYVFFHSLEYTVPRFSAENAFFGFLKGYGCTFESLKTDSQFRFFLAQRIVSHVVLLSKMRKKNLVQRFTGLLINLF